MFKKLFGLSEKEAPSRTLDHPAKLRQGDAIRIGFDEHPELSNAEFFIQKVTGLDLSSKTGYERRVFHLGQVGGGFPLLMWVDTEKGGDRLAFAYGADQPHVEAMLNMDQFVTLFEPDRNYLVEVDADPADATANPWLASRYIQDQASEVYWLDKDPSETMAAGTVSNEEAPCDYFRLNSQDQEAAIEVFVFDGGKTDVYFTKFLPLYKLEEMMPGKQK